MPEVGREVALEEFERLAAAADVDVDTNKMNDGDTEDVEEIRDALASAIEEGQLSVNDKGQAVLSAVDGDPITFRAPKGGDLMILASSTEANRMVQMRRFLCAITGQSTKRIDDLDRRNWMLALKIAGFLAAV